MSRVERLGQWTAGGISLRMLDAPGDGTATESQWLAPLGEDLAGAGFASERSPVPLDDDEAMPAEALPMYRSVGHWRDREGVLRRTTHGFASEAAFARGECVLGQGSLWQEAAALSFASLPVGPPADPGIERSRRVPHDVRPALLLLMRSHDFRMLSACFEYGANYLRAWCVRRGLRRSDQALQAAACDALSVIFKTRQVDRSGRRTGRLNTPTISARAKCLGMRVADYSELRSLLVSVFARRLSEAEERFSACADYVAPKTGRSQVSGIAPETWWHPERSPPANHYTPK